MTTYATLDRSALKNAQDGWPRALELIAEQIMAVTFCKAGTINQPFAKIDPGLYPAFALFDNDIVRNFPRISPHKDQEHRLTVEFYGADHGSLYDVRARLDSCWEGVANTAGQTRKNALRLVGVDSIYIDPDNEGAIGLSEHTGLGTHLAVVTILATYHRHLS